MSLTRPRRSTSALLLTALAAATAVLWFVSRGKWSDAIIDSGREWIVPDALARGELLYRDVVYWVGPFTPYVHAAWLRALGSTFKTLAIAGTVESLAMLAAFFVAARLVVGLLSASLWTALAIPVIVFMPNSGGVLIGLGYRHAATFALLALTIVSRRLTRHRDAELFMAGALCGLAGLCRTEWGIAALMSAALGVVTKERFRARALGEAALLVTAGLLTFGVIIAAFTAAAGFGPVVREGHLLLTGLPDETRRFLITFSGIGDWRRGIPNVLYSFTIWLAVFLLVRLLTLWRDDPIQTKRRLRDLLVTLLLLGLFALLGAADGVILWSGAPAFCLLSAVLGIVRRKGRTSAVLVSFGSMGLLMSHRRVFHIGDSWYVGAPLLFAFVCAAALIRLGLAAERKRRLRQLLSNGLSLVLSLLVCGAFAMRMIHYRGDPRISIAGTGGMVSARPRLAHEIERIAATIRGTTKEGEGLAVFPEGEILNYLSGRPNPCRHKMYLPGYLTQANEAEVLAELQRSPPEAVVIVLRPTSEYGPSFFGQDYGAQIRRWLTEHYSFEPYGGRRHSQFRLGSRRRASEASAGLK